MKADARAKEIFAQALMKESPSAREQYLVVACEASPELRREVESLLDAHGKAGDFLRPPAKSVSADFELQPAGAMIGRYKLLQEIGAGGFAVVYMAEQIEPLQRKVALKIIKAGMDTREVVARFEAERQALALMDHPNIARVHEAGATEAGRPYFVMELVRGIPITSSATNKAYRMDPGSDAAAVYNRIAWPLATCVHAQIRDGDTAVNFAEKAVAETNRRDAGCLDTLAAAYAETSQFHKAISAQEEAIALSPEGPLKENRKARVELYRSKTPFRERRLDDSLFWKTPTKTDSNGNRNRGTPL